MKKAHLFTLFVIIALLIIGGFVTYKIHAIPNDDRNSPALKNLATTDAQLFTDVLGNPVNLENYVGKVRVVVSWATWCPSCATELEAFDQLALTYKDKDVVVLAIDRKEPKEQVERFLDTYGRLPHLVYVIDANDSFFKSVDGYAMPEAIFYDAKGNEVLHKRGDMRFEQMEQTIDSILTIKQ